ncbi:hypothetical protein DC31_17230 [Microbacterium sp. CH12i]|uniref:DUF3560 domain-containing protein n=1 Tax=Microbacterium sp. CH12i TaxID=1479651 RepID=UPI00046128BF|nr:DUF3560 domain-containing protein [Microbacterium sp. CH12i]KDA05280.1 hypothetical protein DC31_17230 [Microbacterium sp. CH12i]
MSITISHSAADGSLVSGTSRGDGSATILKAEGWRWGRSIDTWFLARSRDRAPQRSTIERTAAQLRAAGFTVEISVDDTYRTASEVEADTRERQTTRAARLNVRAATRVAQAEAADAAAARAHAALPPMGEPVKIGHHSEGRHRAAIAKSDAAMRRSIDADQAAKYAAERAKNAKNATDRRYAPAQVVRRIERLESELGAWRRRRDGSSRRLSNGMLDVTAPAQGDYAERVLREVDRLTDELEYWNGIRQQQIADGQVVEYSRETIKLGDLIQFSHVWGKVVRVNLKSVTAVGVYGKMIAPYPRIDGHQPQGGGV